MEAFNLLKTGATNVLFPMCVELSELWTVLTPTTRRNVLQTLSRIIAQQLPTPATGQEVLHERH